MTGVTVTAPSPIDDRVDRPSRSRDPWRIASAITAVVLVTVACWPVVAGGHHALDLAWNPAGDWAILTMRVEDVGRHLPLVGPYSRFGWSHPGPLSYWLLAGPYHLFGGTAHSVLAAAAVLNALTISTIGAVAWRRGRLPLVAVSMVAITALLHAMGPQMLRDPWNPYITLLPLALFVLVMWSIAQGDRALWPLALFVASAEFQSHLGYLPILAAVGVVAVVMAVRNRAEVPLLPSSSRGRRWLLGSSIAVAVVCWLPVVVDQVAGTGNLGAIVGYWLDGGATAGFGEALHQAALQLAIPGAPWLGQKELAGPDGALIGASITALIVPVLAMIGSILLARAVRARAALRLDLLVVTAAIAGVVATAQVVGPLFDWITRWWWVIGALWWMAIGWTLWCAVVAALRTTEQRRVAVVVLAALATLLSLRSARPLARATIHALPPDPSTSEVLTNFLPQTLGALEGSGPVLVRAVGTINGSYADAIRFALEHRGVEIVSRDDVAYKVGEHRSIEHRTPVATVWVVSADMIQQFRGDPEMRFVGMWDPMTPPERAEWFAAEHELQEQFLAVGRPDLAEALTNGTGGVDRAGAELDIDHELLRRVEAGRRRGDPVAVFLGPPSN